MMKYSHLFLFSVKMSVEVECASATVEAVETVWLDSDDKTLPVIEFARASKTAQQAFRSKYKESNRHNTTVLPFYYQAFKSSADKELPPDIHAH